MMGYFRLPGGNVLALDDYTPFPPLRAALREPNGLLAIGGDLSRERLLEAYRHGAFPWYSRGQPIFWWSPDPRMVLFPDEMKISRSLAKRLKKGDYEIRSDTAFRAVMEACAATTRLDQDGTWIVPEMVEAYCDLHEHGYAHSVETWIDGKLAGGLYGVAIGGMFYGESMFHHATDASKIALVHLVRHLNKHGYGMIDCQMHTPHLASMGARAISRDIFAEHLAELVNLPHTAGKWEFRDTLE
jgi:leucyl/phenylalanyl-tRNA--protein transferase